MMTVNTELTYLVFNLFIDRVLRQSEWGLGCTSSVYDDIEDPGKRNDENFLTFVTLGRSGNFYVHKPDSSISISTIAMGNNNLRISA